MLGSLCVENFIRDNALNIDPFPQESTFFFSESLTVVLWGHLSDRYGRRPVLLGGPLGLSLAMIVFGMSTTFWPLVLMRTLQGIFNGNIGMSVVDYI